jgi:hypothetical protein
MRSQWGRYNLPCFPHFIWYSISIEGDPNQYPIHSSFSVNIPLYPHFMDPMSTAHQTSTHLSSANWWWGSQPRQRIGPGYGGFLRKMGVQRSRAGLLISMGKSLAQWIKIGVPPWIGNPHRDKVLMTINRAMYLYWLSTWDITFITTTKYNYNGD